FAVGLDPERSTVFVQSHVHEHTECAWIMECTAAFGELRRMTQFKDKSESASFVSGGLFTYPALQSSDILLYDTNQVPVGEDQRQHVELTRDIAIRFNHRFGETFVVPEAVVPPTGARVMDLQNPTAKMSKSDESPQGTIRVLDDPAVIEKKVKRSVTDSDNEVRFDPAEKPGVSNLLSILGASTGQTPQQAAEGIERYGDLKAATAEALIEMLRPIQERYNELAADPAETTRLLAVGAGKARHVASATVGRAKTNMGLLPA
ncbi:MAG: tryptophan--tRNA ligase, partial [Actinobacteria bacterium]|nr:tryptophan--tRNA ligase [Actinomycetota bacterium]MBT6871979.1 tryptophan--tRNA ligase [Actinomycetota bacterium]